MAEDDLVRTLFMSAFLLGLAAWAIGGFLTQVGGTWVAGDKSVTLKQVGPWVQGDSSWPQGRQVYRGWVFFGRVRLTRYDFGEAHLTALGFNEQQAKALEGVSTGHFWLHRKGQTLDGQFVGRKFSFEGDEVKGVTHVAAVPRNWTRA